MPASEVLEIKCPKCRKIHRYRLNVERSIVMEWISISSAQSRLRRFTRLFTCPTKETDFQATFSLTETSGSPIEAVEVKGFVAGEDENER